MVTTINREEAGDTTVRLKKRSGGEYVVTYERPNERETVDTETPTNRFETAERVFFDRIQAEEGFQSLAQRGEGPRDDLKDTGRDGFGFFGGGKRKNNDNSLFSGWF